MERRKRPETAPVTILFYGRTGKGAPMSKSVNEEHLARALNLIGIPVVNSANAAASIWMVQWATRPFVHI